MSDRHIGRDWLVQSMSPAGWGPRRRTGDVEKAALAAVFYERYVSARQHPEYLRLKKGHYEQHEGKRTARLMGRAGRGVAGCGDRGRSGIEKNR
jgi:hypothetical protein